MNQVKKEKLNYSIIKAIFHVGFCFMPCPISPETKKIMTNDWKIKRGSSYFVDQKLITNSFITLKIESFLCGNPNDFPSDILLEASLCSVRKSFSIHADSILLLIKKRLLH